MGSAVFGKFHLPKLPKNVKQAAFAATSKKNAQRAREDLEAFSNELSRQAESSARRKAPLDEGDASERSGGGDYYDDWCEKHFTNNCACRVKVKKEAGETTGLTAGTAGKAAATTVGAPNNEKHHQQEQQQEQSHYNNNTTDDANSVSSIDGGGISSTNSSHRTYDTSGAVHQAGYIPTTDENTATTSGGSTYSAAMDNKPSFQRPVHKNSALIANGWIEQHRRSKMRFVWKEVLASLVAGQKPGEETTLWIQREVYNDTTGRNELEALHQIPVKVLEEVSLKEQTVDHQFSLKIYNSADEFVFRCSEAPADAMMWVQTLTKYQQIAQGTYRNQEEEEKKGSDTSPSNQYQQQQQQHTRQASSGGGTSRETQAMSIRELRAICHGAGINTAGMERTELERAAEEVKRRGTYFDPKGTATGYHPQQQYAHAPAPSSGPPSSQSQQQQQHAPPPAAAAPPPPATAPADPTFEKKRLGIKELRAICHGAGINTVGMERSELEAAAEEVQKRGTYFDPPPGMHAPSEEEIRAREEELRKQRELRARQDELRRRQEQEAAERQRREAEEARRRAAVAEEERRRVAEEEARRRAAEEHRRRVDEEARRRAAEEQRRRAAAEEQLRRQHEAQARYQQQQAAWRKQQEEEEKRKRAAEQQAAEQRRRHEEAMRKQQQWAGSQQQQWNQQHAYAQQQQQNAWNQQQRQQYPQQQQQQQQPNRNAPPPQQKQYQQQQHQQQHRHSAADEKYAAMASQSQDDSQAVITRIKHGILIQWALQPPQMQMLRPIDVLITSIHKVFPPALGVAGHDYFAKWKPVSGSDLAGPSGLPEEEKLKKSVRKIRFFLHPDKLPNDLNEEQQFMTKMLWDVTSDAWEEYQKHKEDLDWVKN